MKYYKAEDVIRKRAEDLADTSYWEYGNPKNVDDWIEVAEMEFKDLPTIEVMEYPQVEGITPTLVTIEVSEDCISRLQVFELLNAMTAVDSANAKVYARVFSQIKDAPSVVPSRAEGEWVESEIPNELYVCSECGGACWSYDYERNIVKSNYCPNCGAKMKGWRNE